MEHYNCILRAEAVHTGIHAARKTLEEMMESKMGKHIRPNTGTFNAMLEVSAPPLRAPPGGGAGALRSIPASLVRGCLVCRMPQGQADILSELPTLKD